MKSSRSARFAAVALVTLPLAGRAFGADLASTPDTEVSVWQVVAVLTYLMVLGAVGAAIVWYARRRLPSGALGEAGPLRVLGSVRVPPTVTLTIVEIETRKVLIAATPSAAAMIELSRNE